MRKFNLIFLTIFIIIAVCLFVQNSFAITKTHNTANGSSFTEIGSWSCGIAGPVAVNGNIACCGNSGNLEIVDISNLSSPKVLGRLKLSGSLDHIYLKNNLAYVLASDELYGKCNFYVIDISTPTQPKVNSFVELEDIESVVASNNYVYLGNRIGTLYIYDFTTTFITTAVGSISTEGRIIDLDISGDFVFVTNTSNKMSVIDVSNPASPSIVGLFSAEVYDPERHHMEIEINGNIAYLAYHNGLVAVDISSPSNPQQIGYSQYYAGGDLQAFDISDKFAFCVWNSVMYIFDISQSPDPLKVNHYRLPSRRYNWDIAVSDSTAILSNRSLSGYHLLDLSNPTTPEELGFYPTIGANPEAMYYSDDYVFLLTELGLVVVDVSSLENPLVKGLTTLDSLYNKCTITGKTFAKYDIDGVQVVVEVVSQNNLQLVGMIGEDKFSHIEFIGNYGYIADGFKGLKVIDFSIPTHPKELELHLVYHAHGICISDGYAFIGAGNEGLVVFDITSPSQPHKVGQLGDTWGDIDVWDIFLTTNDVIVALVASDHLMTIDISEPSNPQEITSIKGLDYHYYYYQMVFSNNFLYTLVGWGGENVSMYVYNIKDQANPYFAGSYCETEWRPKICVFDNYIYMQLRDYGGNFYILRNDLETTVNKNNSVSIPEFYTLKQNYPNPFNPTTTIQYEVPQHSDVRLIIYDVLGRKVKTLVNRTSQTGAFEITWDGTDEFQNQVAGGVYFCRMEAGEYVKTIKLALVK